MYLKYNWQNIVECSEEMNRIYLQIDSISSQIGLIQNELQNNQLSSMTGQLLNLHSRLNETIAKGFIFSKMLEEIAELFYTADCTILKNNESLPINITDIQSSLHWSKDQSFGDNAENLVVEPWLKKILEEKYDKD